jgi:hypothetical protein
VVSLGPTKKGSEQFWFKPVSGLKPVSGFKPVSNWFQKSLNNFGLNRFLV